MSSDNLRGITAFSKPSSSGFTRSYTGKGTDQSGTGYVYALNDGAGTWSYNVTGTLINYGIYLPSQTVVTDPNSGQRTVALYPTQDQTDLRQGKIVDDTDALGRHTHIDYDSYGRIINIIHPEQDSEAYGYDARGNITSVTKTPKPSVGGPAISTSAGFPASCDNPVTCNKPTWTKDANLNETDYTYDPTHGGVATITKPAGLNGIRPTTTYSYTQFPTYAKDSSGSLVQVGTVWRLTGTSECRTAASCVNTADEVRTTIAYTGANVLPTSTTVAAGDGSVSATTSTAYDVFGNVVSVTSPTGAVTTYAYNAMRQKVAEVDPDEAGTGNHRATLTQYTPDGLVSEVDLGVTLGGVDWQNHFDRLQYVTTTYNAQDLKIADETASGQPMALTQYNYDALNRPNCTAVRLNPSAFGAQPDACSLGGQGSDGPDRISQNHYDAVGQLTSVVQALGAPDQRTYQTTAYNPDGTKATDTDANGNVTTYYYDGFNRLIQVNYPLPGGGGSNGGDYEHFDYDPAGNMVTHRLRDGVTLSMGYDALNRKVTDQNGAGLGYDNLGHLTSASLNGQTASMAYDALGDKVWENDGVHGAIGFNYDAAGNRTQINWPDGLWVHYYRDVDGQVSAITDSGGATLASYGYDDLGRVQGVNRGNGVNTGYGWDSISRLTNINHVLTSADQNQSYGWTYTAASQVNLRSASNTLYDWGGAYAVNRGYAANGLNQMTVSGPYSLGYDARGNLTSDGVNTYTYNEVNQLTGRSGGISLAYDGLGRLSQTTTPAVTLFVYGGDQLLTEYDSSGNLIRRYAPGPKGADDPVVWYEGSSANDRRWLLEDAQGSVVGVTTGGGVLLDGGANSYDEYGIPGGYNQGRFQYTGQLWIPGLDLYHYKARTYSPTLGRFLQTDPIGYKADLDLYAYVGDDPVNHADPSGNCIEDACIVEGGLAITMATQFCIATNCLGQAAQGIRDAGTAIGNALGGIIHNNDGQAPPLPTGPVGTPPHTEGKGGQTQSGPLHPDHGGTGNPDKDFDHLTGGTGKPNETGKRPPGTMVGGNGIQIRPEQGGDGPKIDIPANGTNPGQTLHYPPTPPPKNPEDSN